MNTRSKFRFRLIAAIVASLTMTALDVPVASATAKQQESGSDLYWCLANVDGKTFYCEDKDGNGYTCPSKDSKKEDCTKAAKLRGGAQVPRPTPGGMQMK